MANRRHTSDFVIPTEPSEMMIMHLTQMHVIPFCLYRDRVDVIEWSKRRRAGESNSNAAKHFGDIKPRSSTR